MGIFNRNSTSLSLILLSSGTNLLCCAYSAYFVSRLPRTSNPETTPAILALGSRNWIRRAQPSCRRRRPLRGHPKTFLLNAGQGNIGNDAHKADDTSNSIGDANELEMALKRAQEADFRRFVENDVPPWLSNHESLPFVCTECGKCCQTEGSVYLSPQEIQDAAQVLGMDVPSFIQTYASHTISNDDQTWIRLREKEIESTHDPAMDGSETTTSPPSSSCIFLDLETKHCAIYTARPTQCRTYPFWPPIIKSVETWNGECRSMENESGDKLDNSLPVWTPDAGGCEGMKTINKKISETANMSDEDVMEYVPFEEACSQLYNYVLEERRFPTAEEIEVSTTTT